MLQADFGVKCWEGDHWNYVILSAITIGVFVFGVPLTIIWQLYRFREHFHDTTHHRHREVRGRLGMFLNQFEEKHWSFEVVNLLFKLVLTGILCVVAPGTPFQIIVAFGVCTVNFMVLLREAPYQEDTADRLAITAAMSLAVTLLAGFVAIANQHMDIVQPRNLDWFLVVLNMFPFAVLLVNLVERGMRGKNKTKFKKGGGGGVGSSGGWSRVPPPPPPPVGNTKVVPERQMSDLQQAAAGSWRS